jgi:hypothetical protein
MDVVDDPFLSLAEKKSILSSWASDHCAVVSNPLLRKPAQSRQAVAFEDVLDALKLLDAQTRTASSPRNPRPAAGGRSGAAA